MAMDRFKRYGHDNPVYRWIIDEQEAEEKVLTEALNTQQIEEAYIVVLNDNNHFSVVHTLTQLDTSLRLSNTVMGKIAGFVRNTQTGDTTLNLVVYGKEDTMFSQHSYPRIKWKEIMKHYSQQ
jgi:hypothetical protein